MLRNQTEGFLSAVSRVETLKEYRYLIRSFLPKKKNNQESLD